MRRTILRGVAAVAVAAAAVTGGVVGTRVASERLADDAATADFADVSTARASVGTLSETVEAAGTIGYGTSVEVRAVSGGTVLDIVDAGETLESGDVLARIDDVAIVWLDGETPAWRSLRSGDEGHDVEQLEAALSDLGFNDGTVTVDTEFTDATADMVSRWQESIEVEPTGRVELGSAVYTGDRDRVARVAATVGAQVAPGPLLDIGTAERLATFELTPADAVHLEVGDLVNVMMPDRSIVESTVHTVVRAPGAWTVTSAFTDTDLPTRDTIAVDVTWEYVIADEVLTIPSTALLRLDQGGYVVDVVDEGGRADRRPVTVGVSVGTRTEILSGVTAGDEVIVL